MQIFATSLVLLLNSFSLVCFAFGAKAESASLADQDWVRVRLESRLSSVEISGYSISVQGEERVIEPVALPRAQDSILISREKHGEHLFWRVVSGTSVKIYAHPFLTISGVQLHSGGKTLPGRILLHGNSKFDLIGVVKFRDYLFGVVAKEMPITWPMEALKAQAIAARSYALFVIEKRKHKPYELESSILDQVFSHFDSTNLIDTKLARALNAVDDTQGLILLNSKKKVLQAFYHADCGGRTASSKSALGVDGLVGGVVDASCPANPKARWSYRISKQDLAKILHRRFFETFPIASLDLIPTADKDRVQGLLIKASNGKSQLIRAFDFRGAVGYQDIRSTRFQVRQDNGEFVFSGTGYGHGVGLCQWGSQILARQGFGFRKILNHYYPEATLETRKNFNSKKSDRDYHQHMFN